MGLQPRISAPSRRAAIPMPNRGPSVLADGLQVAAQTFGAIDQNNRQTDLQVDAMDHALEMKKQDAADQHLVLQQSAEWANVQSRIERRLADERNNAQVGAVDHTNKAIDIINEEVGAFSEGFGQNERVKQRFYGSIAETNARYETRETLWENDQFAKAQGEGAQQYLSTISNTLLQNPDLKATEGAMKHWREVIVPSLVGNDDFKAKMDRAGTQQIMGAMLDGRLDAGKFEEVDALLKSGALNDVFDDVEPYMRKVDNERRAAEALAEAQAAAARTEARNAIKAIEEKIAIGINPTPAEIAAVRKNAVAAGLSEADIIALDGLGIQQAVNRQYSEAADPTGARAAADAATLGKKVANNTATEAEQVTYQQLKGVSEARSKATGSALSDLAGQGVQGKMTALSQLDAMDPAQRFAAAEAAQPGLGRFALMGPATRKYALDGQEVRKARPEEFGKKAEVNTAFKMRVGAVARQLGGEYDDVMNSAWNIYAGTINAKGMTGWHPEYFDTAVKIAFGATTRSDGKLQGGVGKTRGHQVVLPPTYTVPEFERSLSRMTFKGAVYAGGTAASKADILEHYRPEYYEDGPDGHAMYRFIDAAGKPLLHKDGSVYNIGFRR